MPAFASFHYIYDERVSEKMSMKLHTDFIMQIQLYDLMQKGLDNKTMIIADLVSCSKALASFPISFHL